MGRTRPIADGSPMAADVPATLQEDAHEKGGAGSPAPP
jgi:hypothetical protein